MVDKENYSNYRVLLMNKKGEKQKTVVEAFCFAEAASQAYLIKNNKNYSATSGWWTIESVARVENKKANKANWGWSSEGEMT